MVRIQKVDLFEGDEREHHRHALCEFTKPNKVIIVVVVLGFRMKSSNILPR